MLAVEVPPTGIRVTRGPVVLAVPVDRSAKMVAIWESVPAILTVLVRPGVREPPRALEALEEDFQWEPLTAAVLGKMVP